MNPARPTAEGREALDRALEDERDQREEEPARLGERPRQEQGERRQWDQPGPSPRRLLPNPASRTRGPPRAMNKDPKWIAPPPRIQVQLQERPIPRQVAAGRGSVPSHHRQNAQIANKVHATEKPWARRTD